MTRRPSPEALREAAEVARDKGVTVRIERDGWVYQITPGDAKVPDAEHIELRDFSR